MSVMGVAAIAIVALVIVLFTFFNEKVLHLPTEIGLMTIAFALSLIVLLIETLGLSFVPPTASIASKFNLHDIIMNGLICFLLFSGSAKLRFVDLEADGVLIASLAFMATLFSALIYGGLTYLVANALSLPMNILEGFMLGSIIAPTDPISAMSILKSVGLSERISLIIEGESLFNDGIAVALFVTFSQLNQASDSSSPLFTFMQTISYNLIGAILIGFFVSAVLFWIFKETNEKHLEVLASITAVTAAYAISEYLEVSAPIAVVFVGMYFATKMNKMHEDYQHYYSNFYGFWEVIDKSLNGMLFIIIGLAILFLHASNNLFWIMLSAISIALIARFVSLIVPVFLFDKKRSRISAKQSVHASKKEIWAMIKLLTWAGLRGGICIALAIGTVNQLSPEVYNYVLISTYAVVAFSILVQGLSIKTVYYQLKSDL